MPRVIFRKGRPNIRVITYPDAMETSWHKTIDLVPRLWNGEKELYRLYIEADKPKTFTVDAMLEMGMLYQPGEAYRLERNSFKGEYDLPDVDGKYPDQDDKTGNGTWNNIPEKLSTDINLDSVYKRVSAELQVR